METKENKAKEVQGTEEAKFTIDAIAQQEIRERKQTMSSIYIFKQWQIQKTRILELLGEESKETIDKLTEMLIKKLQVEEIKRMGKAKNVKS